MKLKDLIMPYVGQLEVLPDKGLPIQVFLYEDAEGNVLDFRKVPSGTNVPSETFMVFSMPLYIPRFHDNGLLMGGLVIAKTGEVKYLDLEKLNMKHYCCN